MTQTQARTRAATVRAGQARAERYKGKRRRALIVNVLKYAVLTAAGIALYIVGARYAYAERGYFAIGGEALALFLPVIYYAAGQTIRDVFKDVKNGYKPKY